MTRGRPKFYPKVDQLFSITSSQSLSSGVSFTESYFWQCSQCTDYGILSDSILYLGLARFALQDAAFWCSYSNRRRLRTTRRRRRGTVWRGWSGRSSVPNCCTLYQLAECIKYTSLEMLINVRAKKVDHIMLQGLLRVLSCN